MFKKGYTPYNKGRHLVHSGSFKKGMTPWNKGKKTGLAPWKGRKRPNLAQTNAEKTMFKKRSIPWNKGMKGQYSTNLCSSCHLKQVNNHEKSWESYFLFNLETRGWYREGGETLWSREKIGE